MMRAPKVYYFPLSSAPDGDHQRGEWFVSREIIDPASSHGTSTQYLHADGEWRRSTYSDVNGGAPTGYFATEDEAKAALKKAARRHFIRRGRPMTDKEHVDRIKAALDVLCECIDDARAAGLVVDVVVNTDDTWHGRREDGVPQVRNRGVNARREYA